MPPLPTTYSPTGSTPISTGRCEGVYRGGGRRKGTPQALIIFYHQTGGQRNGKDRVYAEYLLLRFETEGKACPAMPDLHSNKEGTCFPSIKTIAAECGYGVTTVKRALDDLLEAGYIQKSAALLMNGRTAARPATFIRCVRKWKNPTPSDGGENPPRESEPYPSPMKRPFAAIPPHQGIAAPSRWPIPLRTG